MTGREFHYSWEWQLRSTPEALWPHVSDTQRFNRVTTGYFVNVAGEDEDGVRLIQARYLGVPLAWDEHPFEWERPRRFSVVRRFHGGILRDFIVRCTLQPNSDGTLLRYEVSARPATLFGSLAIPLQVGQISRRRFERAFRRIDDFLQHPDHQVDPYTGGKEFITGAAAQRMRGIGQELAHDGYQPDLIDRLTRFITTAEQDDVAHIRAYVLADRWRVPRRKVLELCLAATRHSLLDLRWDIVCPLCRGVKASTTQLSEIGDHVYCPTCHADFDVNFDHAIEVTFRPNSAIRKVEMLDYCVGGPQLTPHILAQQILAPDENRTINMAFEPGMHRVRTRSERLHTVTKRLELRVGDPLTDQVTSAIKICVTSNGWSADHTLIAPQTSVTLENCLPYRQDIVIERLAWNDQATTAVDVSTVQAFRDWFSTQALRPGVQLGITHLAILFTDLRDSTLLYRMIGDTPAFARVLEHFDVLRQSVDRHQGALIKTIGDAIMAAFLDPASGVRAGIDILCGMAQLNASRPDYPLRLRLGLHSGPALAVTLNERLDYFGTTVNMANRLEGQALGDDLILSADVMRDDTVQRALTESNVKVESFTTSLRGFVDEEFKLYRIRLSDAVADQVRI